MPRTGAVPPGHVPAVKLLDVHHHGMGSVPALPPLAAETHRCPGCAISYAEITVERALDGISALPSEVSDAVAGVPVDLLSTRPSPETWSVLEYTCHLRDVYATSTIRLHRARTETRPVLEPMLNDLRARRFRYHTLPVDAVPTELGANVSGLCDEAARFGSAEWERVVTRLPDEERSARWVLRNALHEGLHHVQDIRDVAAALGIALPRRDLSR